VLLLISVLGVGLNHRFIRERMPRGPQPAPGGPKPAPVPARDRARRFPWYTSQEWIQVLCVAPLVLATWIAARALWLHVRDGDTIASPLSW